MWKRVVAAPLPQNGAAFGVADSSDHGGQGGGEGTLAQAGGAARADTLAPSVPVDYTHGPRDCEPCGHLWRNLIRAIPILNVKLLPVEYNRGNIFTRKRSIIKCSPLTINHRSVV